MANKLLTVEEALDLSRSEVREMYREFVNPGLVQMLSLLDFDKRFVRAEGCYVWDEEGNRYLDFLGGYGSLNLGHNHPRLLATVELVKSFPKLLQASLSPLVAVLACNLAELCPGNLKRCFFGNSGAEAVEGALKVARAATGRTKFVYCEGAFHGKTLGALSVSGREKYRRPFLPLIPDCIAVPFGDTARLEEELKRGDVAAFIVEPIQGEGGVIVPPDGYLARVREICQHYGTLFIADEIQTGLGRTGRMFAVEHDNAVPDIMCISKSLGGGLVPIGAYITTEEIWNKAYGGMDRCLLHTSTFGGNALSVACAITSLNILVEENLPLLASTKGELFLTRLRQIRHPLIREIRGRGLLIGVEFEPPGKLTNWVRELSHEYFASLVAGELMNKFRIITAYTLNNPNVIRLEPPLIVSEEELNYAAEALQKILDRPGGVAGIIWEAGKLAVKSFIRR